MKTIFFTVKFHKDSTHWVNVVVHPTRRQMRCVLTKLGHKDSDTTDACCWQSNKPAKDNCVAELHFAADILRLSSVAHESSHAAYHRAVLMGVPKDADNFQEWIAGDTGIVADAIIAFLDSKRIPVSYGCVKRRMI